MILQSQQPGGASLRAVRFVAVTTTGVPAARYNHSMAWTGNEVLILGGRTTVSVVANDVWCFRKCP